MSFVDVAGSLTPEVYQNLKRAVELGKWPDGRALTPEQREICMEAVLVYESRHLPQQQRTGYLDNGPDACESSDEHVHEPITTLKWLN